MPAEHIIHQFSQFLWLEHGLSDNTRSAYTTDLKQCSAWLANKKIDLVQVKRDQLEGYLQYLYQQKFTARSIARILSALRRFYQWLLLEKHIQQDPTLNIVSPKLGRPLPKSLSENDTEALLAAPDITTALGMRDRAMLELLYAAGLRISELINVQMNQVNLKQGVVQVTGKGDKMRLVPIGENAADWFERYCLEARSELLKGRPSDFVFISQQAKPMTRQTFWHRIKQYAIEAGVKSNISPHTLRHAFATHLLNHGADLRIVQMLLGHSDVSTTTIYTHIAQARLQKLHQEHHPRG